MADPVKRPLKWDKGYNTYSDKHKIYDTFQETLKELAIWKPEDPVKFLRDEIYRIAQSINTPRVFMMGPEIMTTFIASRIAGHCGAKFLTLDEIVRGTTTEIRDHLLGFLDGHDIQNNELRKLLVAIISRRVSMTDCIENGYVLYGFPQSRAQALLAQASGLIPRKVFILLPEGPPEPELKLSCSRIDTNEVNNATSKVEQQQSTKPSTEPSKVVGSAKPSFSKNDVLSGKYQSQSQMSTAHLETYKEFFAVKDIAAVFNQEHVKALTYDKWNKTEPGDLESEFLGTLISKKSQGAPWIPKVLFIGPPGSGKRTLAEYLAKKYKLVVVSWTDMIRGNANLVDDPFADECKQYLEDFTPISENAIAALLKRRLYEDVCQKKGWILHGFPETHLDCAVMDKLALTPNRIFLLSCPEELCLARIAKKAHKILRRTIELPEFMESKMSSVVTLKEKKKETFAQNPYSAGVVKERLQYFKENIDDVINHYGSDIIYVDGKEELSLIKEYVETSTLEPPNIRF